MNLDKLKERQVRPENFWRLVDKGATCWNWLGYLDRDGYGSYRSLRVHRISWLLTHGAFDPELTIDHLCRNTSCVIDPRTSRGPKRSRPPRSARCERGGRGMTMKHPTWKRGWWCSRDWPHDGPCALRPRWWNVTGRRWLRG